MVYGVSRVLLGSVPWDLAGAGFRRLVTHNNVHSRLWNLIELSVEQQHVGALAAQGPVSWAVIIKLGNDGVDSDVPANRATNEISEPPHVARAAPTS